MKKDVIHTHTHTHTHTHSHTQLMKKEENCAICNNLDGPCGIMLSEISLMKTNITYMCKLRQSKQYKHNRLEHNRLA